MPVRPGSRVIHTRAPSEAVVVQPDSSSKSSSSVPSASAGEPESRQSQAATASQVRMGYSFTPPAMMPAR